MLKMRFLFAVFACFTSILFIMFSAYQLLYSTTNLKAVQLTVKDRILHYRDGAERQATKVEYSVSAAIDRLESDSKLRAKDTGSYNLAHPLHWTPDWVLSSDIGEMLEARKRRVIERLDKTVQLIH